MEFEKPLLYFFARKSPQSSINDSVPDQVSVIYKVLLPQFVYFLWDFLLSIFVTSLSFQRLHHVNIDRSRVSSFLATFNWNQIQKVLSFEIVEFEKVEKAFLKSFLKDRS